MQLEPRLSDEIIPDLNNIVRAIEDEFDIVVHDHEVTAETTVGELCALVAREVEKAI